MEKARKTGTSPATYPTLEAGGEEQPRRGQAYPPSQQQSSVVVIATANDISQLPPELLRPGRWDHLVFVDLPSFEDRQEIAAVHLQKRRHDPQGFDLAAIAEATEGFSGAEIETAVKGGLLAAFLHGERAATTADIVARARQVSPMSRVRAEEIDRLRQWARDHGAVGSAGPGSALDGSGRRHLEV